MELLNDVMTYTVFERARNYGAPDLRRICARVHFLDDGDHCTAGQFICETDGAINKRSGFLCQRNLRKN